MRSRRRPDRRGAAALAGLAVALAVVAARVFASGGGSKPLGDAVGSAHPVVALDGRAIVVLRAPSVADRISGVGFATEAQERDWAASAYAAQRDVLTRLAAHGFGVRPDTTYACVLDGFSGTFDPRALAFLDADPAVAGVYPVRAAFPAFGSGSANGLSSASSDQQLAAASVTVALLGTGAGRVEATLQQRMLPAIDIARGSAGVFAAAGTGLAEAIAGAGGASVMPIRVAAAQRDAVGQSAVYARSDQLIDGLERAVDPNGDGDTHDAARIAVLSVVEPFAAFRDSPEARAVAGAVALDTLVVVPAGDDGVAGPLYGSLAGPAGADGALVVGAAEGETPDRAASTSSRGLTFSGTPAPQLIAGRGAGSGTADAAVAVAATAAHLIAARPSLAARDIASLLAGSAAVPGGELDPRRAAEGEITASETMLGFDLAARVRVQVRLVVRNFSARRRSISITAPARRGVAVSVVPDAFELAPGAERTVEVRALRRGHGGRLAVGAVRIGASGLRPLRIGWAAVLKASGATLLTNPHIAAIISPTVKDPAELRVHVGRVGGIGTVEIVPAARVDVLLATAAGTPLGRLARVRDLLPGTYTFGLTGLGPDGTRLPPGRYRVEFVAWPTGAGPPCRMSVTFGLE